MRLPGWMNVNGLISAILAVGVVGGAAFYSVPSQAQKKGTQSTNPQPVGNYYRDANGLWQPVTPSTPLPVDAAFSGTVETSAVATAAAPTYSEGTVNPLSIDLAGGLRVSGTINASSSAQATAANPAYGEGTEQPLSQDLSGHLRTAATQSGSWDVGTVTAVTGITNPVSVQSATSPVSTMNSASANAGTTSPVAGVFDDTTPTAITENNFGFLRMSANRNLYGTIRDAAGNERGANVNASNQLSVTGPVTAVSGAFASGSLAAGSMVDLLTMRGTVAAGTAAANSMLTGAVFNSTPITVTNGQQAALQSDANGFLKVNVAAGGASGGTSSSFAAAFPATGTAAGMSQGGNMVALTGTAGSLNVNVTGAVGLAQGSTTSGQTGSLVMGAVTTSAPTYTTAQTSPLSLDTAGNLRVSTGTVTVTATNLSTNVAQMNGVAVTMGNGASGTGVQRVALANDSSAIAGWGLGATGSAAPSGAQLMGVRSGANMVAAIQASASVALSMNTATTTQQVALVGGQAIYVTSWDVVAAGTTNVTLVYGTGANCGTGTTALTGAYNLIAQAGISKGGGLGPVLVVPAGNALCVTNSAAVQISGSISYTQF